MEKCRICLQYKKNLCSVFELERGISIADMLTSVANVKIGDCPYKNSICLQCRRKLRDLYNFKREIEESDLLLNKKLNIFKFNNIHEVKEKLLEETKNKKNIYTTSLNINCTALQDDFRSLVYKNTTITKIGSYTNCIKTENVVNTDLDIDAFEYETDNNFADYDDSNYEPPKEKRLKLKSKEKVTEKVNERKIKDISGFKLVRIKPIFIKDIRVIPTHPSKRKKLSNNKDRKRMDMCPHCGKMASNIKKHILTHIGVKKYKCSECIKAFYTSQLLKYHLKEHLNAGKFKCDHCVAAFNTKASLQSHMTTHIDDRSHICPICNKGFKRKSALRRHKLIHNAIRSVNCDLCNMSFHDKQRLRHHMRVHTGERPFKCEICSQPYSYKHDFNRHCFKKHGVFLKRRFGVNVMNEEVLKKERALMKDLMLRVQGVVNDGEPLNPFKGPLGALALNAAVEALGSCQIPIDTVL